MKRLLVIALILAGLGGLAYWLYSRSGAEGPRTLALSGHIEATETDLSFKVPGKIAAVNFWEGDEVKAGQVVAELEGRDLRDNVRLAQAAVGTAQANLAKLLAGSRPQEIAEAKAALDQAAADLRNKRRDYERMESLYQQGVVTTATRDNAQTADQVAQEAQRQARERFRLVQIGPRIEDIDAARMDLKRAQANLELAQTNLGYARSVAPVNGVVLVREAEPGEVVSVGSPVLTTGDLDNAYLEAYVPETDLAKVRYGQRAAVTTDTYPGKRYRGWVSFVSSRAEFTPKTVETKKERVTMVYRTKIRVDNPQHELKSGMPADGIIYLDSRPR